MKPQELYAVRPSDSKHANRCRNILAALKNLKIQADGYPIVMEWIVIFEDYFQMKLNLARKKKVRK